jgi:hypothetical protein
LVGFNVSDYRLAYRWHFSVYVLTLTRIVPATVEYQITEHCRHLSLWIRQLCQSPQLLLQTKVTLPHVWGVKNAVALVFHYPMSAVVNEDQHPICSIFLEVVNLVCTFCHFLCTSRIKRCEDFIEFELEKQISHVVNVQLSLRHIRVKLLSIDRRLDVFVVRVTDQPSQFVRRLKVL